MDDWMKVIVTLIVAAAFITVIVGITQPTISTLSQDQRLVSCTKNTWCYMTYNNQVDLVVGNGTGSKVLTTTVEYVPDLTNGRVNITNMTGTATFNLSYTYYPDEYDTGASGTTTRSIAGLIPAGFVLVVLVIVFSTAIALWKKHE